MRVEVVSSKRGRSALSKFNAQSYMDVDRVEVSDIWLVNEG